MEIYRSKVVVLIVIICHMCVCFTTVKTYLAQIGIPDVMPNTGTAIRYITSVTTTTLRKLSHKPVRDICGMVTRPLPNTTALGPVPEGNMNAHEQANVAGIIRRNGCAWPAMAMVAKTGRKILAVAVLELISVMKVMNNTTSSKTKKSGKILIKPSSFPIQVAKPVSENPLAIE